MCPLSTPNPDRDQLAQHPTDPVDPGYKLTPDDTSDECVIVRHVGGAQWCWTHNRQYPHPAGSPSATGSNPK